MAETIWKGECYVVDRRCFWYLSLCLGGDVSWVRSWDHLQFNAFDEAPSLWRVFFSCGSAFNAFISVAVLILSECFQFAVLYISLSF